MKSKCTSHQHSRRGRSLRIAGGFVFCFAGAACNLDWNPEGANIDTRIPAPPEFDERSTEFPDAASGAPDADTVEPWTLPGLRDPNVSRPTVDCDHDKDGFNDLTRAGCQAASGPHDCDDEDARVRPGQVFLDEPIDEIHQGDWNCEGGVERLYASNVSCGVLALGACAGVQGFSGAPACGEEGEFIECQVTAIIGCTVGRRSTRKQMCK